MVMLDFTLANLKAGNKALKRHKSKAMCNIQIVYYKPLMAHFWAY